MRAFSFRDPTFLRMVQGGGGGGGGGGGSYPAGAVTAWHFDNSLVDATGNGNDLTKFHTGSPAYFTGKIGSKALTVDWVNSGQSFFFKSGTTTDLQAASAFSIAAWFRTNDAGLFATHCPSGDQPSDDTYHYRFGRINSGGGLLQAALNAGADVVEVAFTELDVWVFGVMVYDGAKLKLSKNGAAFSEMTPSAAPTIGSGDFWVGGGESGGGMYVDELVKWNAVLTIEQVQYLYNGGNGRAYA